MSEKSISSHSWCLLDIMASHTYELKSLWALFSTKQPLHELKPSNVVWFLAWTNQSNRELIMSNEDHAALGKLNIKHLWMFNNILTVYTRTRAEWILSQWFHDELHLELTKTLFIYKATDIGSSLFEISLQKIAYFQWDHIQKSQAVSLIVVKWKPKLTALAIITTRAGIAMRHN